MIATAVTVKRRGDGGAVRNESVPTATLLPGRARVLSGGKRRRTCWECWWYAIV